LIEYLQQQTPRHQGRPSPPDARSACACAPPLASTAFPDPGIHHTRPGRASLVVHTLVHRSKVAVHTQVSHTLHRMVLAGRMGTAPSAGHTPGLAVTDRSYTSEHRIRMRTTPPRTAPRGGDRDGGGHGAT
jgi:hypothetical protein